MTNLARQLVTESEYLALERASLTKHEYYKGEIFAMAGAKRVHSAIAGNIITYINIQLAKRPCMAYNSDMRVQVNANGLYTYPDISALCGEEKYLDKTEDTLLNPSLILEVLSESTEKYDRGKKFVLYRELESLQEYVLVSSEYKKVEVFRRTQNNQWLLTDYMENDSIVFESINASLTIEEIYNKVKFQQV